MARDEEQTTATARAAAEPRTARGVLVAAASLLIPGAGQLAVGAWRRGLVLLAITALLLLAALGGEPPSQVALDALTGPGGLTELLVGNVLLAVFRIYATLDAFRLGSGGRGRRSTADQALTQASVGAVAALATFSLAPHAVAAHYTLVADGMLGSVFAPPDVGEGRPGDARSVPTGTSRPGDEVTQEADGVDPVDHRPSLGQDGRLTVAVLGSDAAPGRPGHRTDAMMVVSVHPENGRLAVFSVERHLRDFPLPEDLQEVWHARCRDLAPGWDLLNSIYRCGDEVLVDEVAAAYPGTPDPAAAAVADTLGIMLGLPVDHYVMVDMAGFVEVVDALGGIDVGPSAPQGTEPPAPKQGCDWRAFDVQPESQHLDGEAALELVRNRDGTFEPDRMARQRCLLMTLAQQVETPTLLRRFGQLAGVLRRDVVTSIPLNEVPAVIELLGDVEPGDAVTVGFGQPDHVLAGDSPHLDRIREDVATIVGGSSGRAAMPRGAR